MVITLVQTDGSEVEMSLEKYLDALSIPAEVSIEAVDEFDTLMGVDDKE